MSLVFERCQALRELELSNAPLERPSAPLAHLTRLVLCNTTTPPGGAAQGLRLAASAPRLEVLAWRQPRDGGAAEALRGHPALRELRLDLRSLRGDEADTCLCAAAALPRLTALLLNTKPPACTDGSVRETVRERGPRLSRWLQRFTGLARLALEFEGALPWARELLAGVGKAADGRLRSLELAGYLPPDAIDAGRVLHVLPDLYPRLESADISLCGTQYISPEEWAGAARDIQASLPWVGQRCPALARVTVRVTTSDPDVAVPLPLKFTWSRPDS